MNSYFKTILCIAILLTGISCKNEPKSNTNSTPSSAEQKAVTGDVSKFENLNHDFNIIAEGSKLFLKGFFNNGLVNSAITIDKGSLHVANGVLTNAEFNLNMNSLAMVASRNEDIEAFMKSDKAFDAVKFATGTFKISECIKAVNDQQATHILKGNLTLHGKTVPFDVRARIDYTPKNLAINSDQIIIKASDLGIKPTDPSQENIYFSLTLNGNLK